MPSAALEVGQRDDQRARVDRREQHPEARAATAPTTCSARGRRRRRGGGGGGRWLRRTLPEAYNLFLTSTSTWLAAARATGPTSRPPATSTAPAAAVSVRRSLSIAAPKSSAPERQQQRQQRHLQRAQLAEQDRQHDEGARPTRSARGRRWRRRACGVQAALPQASAERADDQQQRARAEHRPAVEHDRVQAARATADRHVAARAGHRRDEHRRRGGQRAARRRRARGSRRTRRPGRSSATMQPEHEPRVHRLLVQQHRREQRDVERHHAEQHGGQARGHVLLGPVDQPVGERERQQPEQRRQARGRCAAGGAGAPR